MKNFYKIDLSNGCTVYYTSRAKFASVFSLLNYLINGINKYAYCDIIGITKQNREHRDAIEID